MRTTRCIAALLLFAAATPIPTDAAELPAGFEQILPRGTIASIDDPEFVKPSQASIRDGAWVLGVELEGEARAYSLALLNSHEVVNDRIAGTAFAAVW